MLGGSGNEASTPRATMSSGRSRIIDPTKVVRIGLETGVGRKHLVAHRVTMTEIPEPRKERASNLNDM